MLYPTAGCKLYIGASPGRWPGGDAASSAGWVEIGETEAIGTLGVEWEMAEASFVLDSHAVIGTAKSPRRAMPMQIVMGNDPEDAGQQILWRAAHGVDAYPFLLVLPNHAGSRRWIAEVTAISEVFDTANSVTRLQADLMPDHSPIPREGY